MLSNHPPSVISSFQFQQHQIFQWKSNLHMKRLQYRSFVFSIILHLWPIFLGWTGCIQGLQEVFFNNTSPILRHSAWNSSHPYALLWKTIVLIVFLLANILLFNIHCVVGLLTEWLCLNFFKKSIYSQFLNSVLSLSVINKYYIFKLSDTVLLGFCPSTRELAVNRYIHLGGGHGVFTPVCRQAYVRGAAVVALTEAGLVIGSSFPLN